MHVKLSLAWFWLLVFRLSNIDRFLKSEVRPNISIITQTCCLLDHSHLTYEIHAPVQYYMKTYFHRFIIDVWQPLEAIRDRIFWAFCIHSSMLFLNRLCRFFPIFKIYSFFYARVHDLAYSILFSQCRYFCTYTGIQLKISIILRSWHYYTLELP